MPPAPRSFGGTADVDDFGPPTESDNRAMRGRARQNDDMLAEIYEQGQADARAEARRNHPSRPARGRKTSGSKAPSPIAPLREANAAAPRRANDGAGLVMGAVLYAVMLNYLRGGPDGVRAWFGAKFLNKPAASGYGPLTKEGPASRAARQAGSA